MRELGRAAEVRERKVLRQAIPLVAILTIVSLFAAVALFAVACGGGAKIEANPQPPSPPIPQRPATPVPTPTAEESGGENGGGTPVAVGMRDVGGSGEYKFVDSEFTFAAGEKVTFTFTTQTEYHSFTVDELEIDFEVDADTTDTFTFTFDTPGTYTLICVPHEAQGMLGTITVQ